MTVLDAQAVIAFLRDEPAAEEVEGLLRTSSARTRLASVNLAEVVDVLVRLFRLPVDEALAALAVLEAGGLDVVAVDRSIGLLAGELHARQYDRKTSPLSMADCAALATALALGEPLATSDPPLARAAEAEGVVVVGLMDSRRHRP